MDTKLNSIIDDLRAKYDCNVIILYGSRARGDETLESDYDIFAVRSTRTVNAEKSETIHDARLFEGNFLDAFIYSRSEIDGKESDMLRILGGKVLVDQDSYGKKLLKKVHEHFLKGPKALSETERQTRKTWIEKMLSRARKGDIEGNFRRVWLAFELLENYFALRNQWYLGPKESFKNLKNSDPDMFLLFENALKEKSEFKDLELAASAVIRYV